jgi:hypothetical protein
MSPHDDGTLRTTDDLAMLRKELCADVDQQRAYANLRRITSGRKPADKYPGEH